MDNSENNQCTELQLLFTKIKIKGKINN